MNAIFAPILIDAFTRKRFYTASAESCHPLCF